MSAGLHSTTQLAGILGVSAARIRAWTRQGLIRPTRRVGRLCFFDFREITSARALQRLRAAGVPPRRIRRALDSLRTWAPDVDNALAHLEASEGGGPLVIRSEEGDVLETTGQMRLDLDPATAVRIPAPRLHATPPPSWFERGIEAEEDERLEEAAGAYERAIALEGPAAELCFNLGNVLHATGRRSEAAARFREAVVLEPDYAEAWNNLGNALSDLEEHEAALEALERAIQLAPGYADPHYNLAHTLEAMGRTEEARARWRTYLGLDPHSPWANEARKRLERP
jgi:tetratricopeptide (TPR) repeat protein